MSDVANDTPDISSQESDAKTQVSDKTEKAQAKVNSQDNDACSIEDKPAANADQ